ncbi:hypothetical protein [Crocosphaera sp. XPORK-15E]|uniref:hypothetical protein n=1 Tax=Crocosphaera sp. XPORK-15E TaxID=3110247 RepID=UPI002B1F80F3|nr:hypothetical protein [Crocosphaera sp. XPORK-15E]MEA5536787.1 hypothetical protein [Crocosphaera sp. XPORK-15E]
MFWPRDLQTWIEVTSNLSIIFGAFITGLWVYSKFIAERGIIPSVKFDLTLENKGVQSDKYLLEIFLYLKNLGSSTLVVHNLRIDLRYLNQTDDALIFGDENKKGRLSFINSLEEDLLFDVNVSPVKPQSSGKGLKKNKIEKLLDRILFFKVTMQEEKRGIKVIGHDTFVRPQIEQIYTFGTVVPKSATYILVWSSFEYKVYPSRLQLGILRFSRVLGLTQFNLTHITKPHTFERIFNLQESSVKSSS